MQVYIFSEIKQTWIVPFVQPSPQERMRPTKATHVLDRTPGGVLAAGTPVQSETPTPLPVMAASIPKLTTHSSSEPFE